MDVYEELIRLRQEGRICALASIINTQGSIPGPTMGKMLIRDDGSIVGTVGGGGAELEVMKIAHEVIEQERPQIVHFDLNKRPGIDAGMVCGGSLEVYVEPIVPTPTVFIFGAGHTGLATYRAALAAGFDVVIVDDRDAFANWERFPDAKDIILADLDAAMAQVKPTPSSFILSLTPGHLSDMRVLRWATGTQARYIGMLGSKRKVTGLFHELQKEGVSAASLSRVHAPVGLDIGAETPEEIAVSVVAEMVACRRRCSAALPHLRLSYASATEAKLREVG
jgi:xanthine dehydrogenase accessory factor